MQWLNQQVNDRQLDPQQFNGFVITGRKQHERGRAESAQWLKSAKAAEV